MENSKNLSFATLAEISYLPQERRGHKILFTMASWAGFTDDDLRKLKSESPGKQGTVYLTHSMTVYERKREIRKLYGGLSWCER